MVRQQLKMLTNLEAWLGKAAEFAESRSFSPDNYLALRLAPDQFQFVRQVQSACDTAKFIASRLSGTEAPKHADDEKTFEDVIARVKSTVEYLGTVDAEAIVGGLEREIRLPAIPKGKHALGEGYLVEFAIGNFYFHLTNAYAILRHAGVVLGKRDFIGSLPLLDD